MEEPTYLRTARLLSAAPSDRSSLGFNTGLAYEPMDTENKKGQLFIVIEVMCITEVAKTIAEKVIEVAKEEYFRDPEESITKSFEATLMAVNEELGSLAESGRIDWIGKLSAIVATVCGSELHLSKTGNAEAYLMRREATSHLSEGLANPADASHPLKTFTNIISGELFVGDKLVLTTPGIFYHLSVPELHNITVEHSPSGAITYLSKMLSKSSDARAALLVIEATTPEILSYEITHDEPSEVVLKSPSGPLVPKDSGKYTKYLGALGGIVARVTALFNKNNFDLSLKPADLLKPKNFKHNRGLLLLVGAGILILTLTLSISGKRAEKIKTAEALRLDHANALVVEAETTLLYDKLSALKLLEEAKGIAEELTKSGNFKTQAKSLIESIDGKILVAKGIYRTETKQLANLESQLPGAAVAVFLHAGSLFVFDNGGTIAKVNQGSGEAERASHEIEGSVVDVAYNERAGTFYLLTDAPEVYSYRPVNDTFKKLSSAKGFTKGSRLEVYPTSASSDVLYILSTPDSAVYSYTKIGDGYAGRKTYYQGGEAGSAVDMSVDNFVYLLNGSGGVSKFSRGKLIGFELKPLEPMTQTTRLISDRGVNNLYVFDKGEKSIFVFDKSGTYIQKTSLGAELTDLEIDESKRTFYLLSGKSLLTASFGN